jgi:hypothetical protein
LLLALHGFRARLQDVELAVGAVLAPFDVHRAAVVLLDDAGNRYGNSRPWAIHISPKAKYRKELQFINNQ